MLCKFRRVLKTLERRCSTSTLIAKNPEVENEVPEYETRLLKVAVIGIPNAGKSTFINQIMDRKVCPTSSKVHTTRAKSMAIFTEGESQIVFFDTPGLVNLKEQKRLSIVYIDVRTRKLLGINYGSRYNLGRTFIKDSKSSLNQVDLIGVIHDASNVWTREKLDIKIIRLLEENIKKPSVLILNKVDLLQSKRKLLDITRILTESCLNGKPMPGITGRSKENKIKGWPNFEDIYMVSSLTGSGLEQVKNGLIARAKPSKWMFPPDVWSDQSPEDIIVQSVKAKLLDFLPQEIPYELKPEMEMFEVSEETGAIAAVVLVHSPSERIAKFVAGAGEGKLRQITESLQRDLISTFNTQVRIRVILKCKEK